ncbi:hypothetical protein THAOC_14700 [Thalassiosira oceanica]|uniref:DUF6820 domain-containing protein n=1 Tax=Thalassiosira oceanica TaxID=159749 RepID=K0T268_THAOC|nr:hypothetical protein THAOC_14700 [Thalassiosira oceanica]|eukprot:EJK64557.1 hypothetical protein THAOC_14700 [Thalassiosira oceanica]
MASLGRGELLHNTSLRQTAVGNIESKLIDEVIPAAASSDLQIRTRTGGQPTEVPPRSPAQISGQKEVNDVINGSGTSAGRARLMMSEFAVAPARLIDNGGRAMGAIIGPPGEAMEELDSPYRRCAGRADRDRQGAVVAHIYRQDK